MEEGESENTIAATDSSLGLPGPLAQAAEEGLRLTIHTLPRLLQLLITSGSWNYREPPHAKMRTMLEPLEGSVCL